jgi:hypothetical protein
MSYSAYLILLYLTLFFGDRWVVLFLVSLQKPNTGEYQNRMFMHVIGVKKTQALLQ